MAKAFCSACQVSVIFVIVEDRPLGRAEELPQRGHEIPRREPVQVQQRQHPTEAINGRLEALRRNALGFRNLTHYRLRWLLHSGALHKAANAL